MVDLKIIDNCFDQNTLKSITSYFDEEEFSFIQSGSWKRVFRILDGNCLKGPEYFSQVVDGQSLLSFPTNKPLDHLIKLIISSEAILSPVLGSRGETWDIFSIRPYIYPAGTGLSWHDDQGYAGAFIFYAHSTWKSSWGGELLLRTGVEPTSCEADGVYIEPKPNRLVVFRSGIKHTIKKVEACAGDNTRKSLTGFFFKESILQIKL